MVPKEIKQKLHEIQMTLLNLAQLAADVNNRLDLPESLQTPLESNPTAKFGRSRKQQEIFRLLGQHPNKSNKELADLAKVEPKTLDAHMQNLRKRLDLKSLDEVRALAIRTAGSNSQKS